MDKFEAAIAGVEELMTTTERSLAQTVLSDLRKGANTLIDADNLEGGVIPNKVMHLEAGIHCADVIASWVKKRIVAGPFSDPPLQGFRSNPLFVVERNNKFRPILDLSSPDGSSFNDSISKHTVPPIEMASPRAIADSIFEWGEEATLSKLDHKSAFKLVPVRPDLVRFQGFSFLGKWFAETQLVFGSGSSPAIYDRLHEVFLTVVRLRSGVDRRFLHRTLDDFVAATPDLATNQRVTTTYMELADEIGLPLAPLDDGDKAFIFKQQGVVLGVELDSRDKQWRLPIEKVNRHRRAFYKIMGKDVIDCNLAEQALGMTQSVTNMLPVLKPLTAALLEAVQYAKGTGHAKVTTELRKTAHRWLGIYSDLAEWRPISHPIRNPPLTSPVVCTRMEYNPDREPTGIAIWGASARRLTWTRALIDRICYHQTAKLTDPGLFLQAVGALCAIMMEAQHIRNTHFTFVTTSPMLSCIYRKGRDKKCKRTTQIIGTITRVLVHLNALPSFQQGIRPVPRVCAPAAIPEDIFRWLRKIKPKVDFSSHLLETLRKEEPTST